MRIILIAILFCIIPSYVSAPYGTYNNYQVKNATPSKDEIVSYIKKTAVEYGVDPDIALRIAFAESSFNPFATNTNTNGTTDKGVFQINSIHGVPDDCSLDYKCNTNWAMQTMSTAGTTPWLSSYHNWKGGEYD